MAMGDAGATAIVMVGEVCGRRRRASMSYSYVDLRREAIFESVPARTDLAGFLLKTYAINNCHGGRFTMQFASKQSGLETDTDHMADTDTDHGLLALDRSFVDTDHWSRALQ